jgi:hypothetical protein
MENAPETKTKPLQKNPIFLGFLVLIAILAGLYTKMHFSQSSPTDPTLKDNSKVKSAVVAPPPQLDFAAYDKKMLEIANLPPPTGEQATASASSTLNLAPSGWPVKTVYPNYGALLPFNRIVAYYGNLYSRYMGVLGEYPEDEMLDKLSSEVGKWQAADPATPVVPALHYIAVVAQAGPTRTGKYIARMPDKEIDKVLAMAKKINGIVFLDIQAGQSTVQTEIPLLEKYLKLPNVHLGLDPEFAMQDGSRPGTVIGTLDAKDINFAAEYLAKIVKENNLTPKILVVHRFTQRMITNYKNITPLPEVQIVMEMDGFGGQAKKKNTYRQFIAKEPVQFTGFKLFYKNDNVEGGLLTPEQLLKLSPIPSYIQYQ